MSESETNNYSLRELVRLQLTEMKLINLSLSELRIHSGYTKEKVDEHDKDIDSLKESRQHQKGVIFALGIIGLAGIADFIKRITS